MTLKEYKIAVLLFNGTAVCKKQIFHDRRSDKKPLYIIYRRNQIYSHNLEPISIGMNTSKYKAWKSAYNELYKPYN